jgi:DNA mismatch repair protein MutL
LNATQHQKNVKQKIYFIKYKGFRGEALASIAAICSCRDEDKARSRELGTQIIIEGKFVSQEIAVLPKELLLQLK